MLSKERKTKKEKVASSIASVAELRSLPMIYTPVMICHVILNTKATKVGYHHVYSMLHSSAQCIHSTAPRMSTRSAFSSATRALGTSLRPSPIAGPSRIPINLISRRHINTADHPTVDRLASEICVRTSKPFPSILHALAILRAVEASYGQVINLQVLRDTDSLQPTNMMFMTLLEPIDVSKRLLHEIPAPVSSLGTKERYGGPSLEDVRAVLSARDPAQTKPIHNKNGTETGAGVITFEVEARKNAGRTRTKSDPTFKAMTLEMVQEDEKILDALNEFGSGFFGGFEGVTARHRAEMQHQRGSLANPNRIIGRGRTPVESSVEHGQEGKDAEAGPARS